MNSSEFYHGKNLPYPVKGGLTILQENINYAMLSQKYVFGDNIKHKVCFVNQNYTTFTNFSMKYHLMCKVYTDVGGIK